MITVLTSFFIIHEMNDTEVEVNAYQPSSVYTVGNLVPFTKTMFVKFIFCHNIYNIVPLEYNYLSSPSLSI